MAALKLLRAVQPFIAAIAVIATACILVAAIYYTLLDLEWIAFLTGILVAAILAMVTRASRAEFAAARRGARLSVVQERLTREVKHRESLEKTLEAAREHLHYSDDLLPVMIAFVGSDSRYLYHNRAMRNWVGLPPEQINGHHMREVLGNEAFSENAESLAKVMAGENVQFSWVYKMPHGAVYHLSAQYVPIFDAKGKFGGFYQVLVDMTAPDDLQKQAAARAAPAPGAESESASAGKAAAWKETAARISAAIERNEFALFFQVITPLKAQSGQPVHHEILVRLIEEEHNLIPPGAFFPLAEEYGLLPQLDRWVVSNVLWEIASRRSANAGKVDKGIFFLNVATDTVGDPEFPAYIGEHLKQAGVAGGAICFEITQTDLSSRRNQVERFARQVKALGCHVALSGFGSDRRSIELWRQAPLDFLKSMPLDFLKIDGSLVLNMLRNPEDLHAVLAITRIAKVTGKTTVAEMVESKDVLAKLREMGVEYAEGFGISLPEPISNLKH